MRRLILTLVAALLTSEAASQALELSLEDGRALARQAALNGQFQTAVDFADALLDADPDDRVALIVLAASQPQIGEPREGRRAGARAFRLSQTEPERYEAARLTALAAANEERYTLAQYWLRRAAINAPNEQALTQTRTDFRGIRRLNPLSFNIRASASPSSNLNGGSTSDENCLVIDDQQDGCGILSGDAEALSGWDATADLSLNYAISRNQRQATFLTARGYARRVWLSNDAQEQAPDNSNSDFSSEIIELGVRQQRQVAAGVLTGEAIYGWSWFSGQLTAQYVRGRLGYSRNISERTAISVTGQIDSIEIQSTTAERTNTARTLSGTLSHSLENGARVFGTLSLSGQSSDQSNEQFEAATFQLGYTLAEPVGPAQLTIAGGVGLSDYPNYNFFFTPIQGGRQDTRLFANVSAEFPDVEYGGFIPVLTANYQDATSNISRFERDTLSLRFSIRSSF